MLSKYPRSFQPGMVSSCIDQERDLLYVCGDNIGIIGIFNLNEKSWKYELDDEFVTRERADEFPSICLVSPLNEVHIYSESNFKFNGNNKTLIKLKENKEVNQLLGPKLLYIKLTNQLMIFGGSFKTHIYFSNVNDNNQTNYEWQLYSKKLPVKCAQERYDAILAFEHLIFVFYRDRYKGKKIYLLFGFIE